MAQQTEYKNSTREISLVNNRLKSSDIFQCSKELTIVHNEQEYRLRLTGNDKLILTK